MRWRLGRRHRGDRVGRRAKSKLAIVPVVACLNAVIAIIRIDPIIAIIRFNSVIAIVLTGSNVAVAACGSPGDSSDRSFPDL